MDNGKPGASAGCAFRHGFDEWDNELVASFALEAEGPFGRDGTQTSNRAELRAVIAALRFRDWSRDGFYTVVIATDSTYVVNGATKWVKRWVKNGWTTRKGAPVKNQDLWEMLLGEFERYKSLTLDVQFDKIPREKNHCADAAAKKACSSCDRNTTWTDLIDESGQWDDGRLGLT